MKVFAHQIDCISILKLVHHTIQYHSETTSLQNQIIQFNMLHYHLSQIGPITEENVLSKTMVFHLVKRSTRYLLSAAIKSGCHQPEQCLVYPIVDRHTLTLQLQTFIYLCMPARGRQLSSEGHCNGI